MTQHSTGMGMGKGIRTGKGGQELRGCIYSGMGVRCLRSTLYFYTWGIRGARALKRTGYSSKPFQLDLVYAANSEEMLAWTI